MLYIAGCSNGAAVCSGNTRNAMDPRTGQILTVPGAANTQAAIGTPIPDTGNPLNGIKQAGDGISKTGYTWPALVVGPALRRGLRHDRATRRLIFRGGGGYVLRPSRRQHGVLDPGQSADRDVARTCGTASCRPSARASAPPVSRA